MERGGGKRERESTRGIIDWAAGQVDHCDAQHALTSGRGVAQDVDAASEGENSSSGARKRSCFTWSTHWEEGGGGGRERSPTSEGCLGLLKTNTACHPSSYLHLLSICVGVLLDEVIVRLVELAQFMLNISARVTVSLLDLTREGTEVSASDLVGAWKGCEGGPRPSGSPSWRHRCCSQGEEARPAPCKHRVDKMSTQ